MSDTFEYTKGVCVDFEEAVEINADHLLAHGVIVPPCKVGDVLFRLDKADVERPIKMGVIDEIQINKYGTAVVIVDAYLPLRRAYPSACIGKIVFLTREDAEKALEEMCCNLTGKTIQN